MNSRNQEHQHQQEQKPALASSKAWVEGQGSKTTSPSKADQLRDERMARHTGSEAYRRASDGLTAVVVATNGDPCAYGYRGRSMKPAFRYRFHDEAQREKFVTEWLDSANRSIAEAVARKAERRAPHSLAVGDVLYSSWGYDQTNIDFYEVTAVRGAVVDLAELQQQRTEHGLAMQGTCVAIKGAHKGAIYKGKRPSGENAVRIDSCSTARPWDGRPLNWSSYA